MIELKFINAKNKEMNAIDNEYMTISDIDSLHGVDNEFSSSTSPYVDGDVVNHVRTNPRTIILTYVLKTPIERSLNFFNSMVKSKQIASLIETREDGTEIKIDGIVTVPPYTRLSNQVAVQIQLYCPAPYWEDVETLITDISMIVDMHEFSFESGEKLLANDGGLAFPASLDAEGNLIAEGIPLSSYDTTPIKKVVNEGDVPAGVTIKIVALEDILNPRIVRDGVYWLQINALIRRGEWVEINTNRGEKSIDDSTKTLGFGHITYSGNDWLQLETGENELEISAWSPNNPQELKTGSVYFTIYYKRKWQ